MQTKNNISSIGAFFSYIENFADMYIELAIDFVRVRRDERVYLQVCDRLPEHPDRETANLMGLRDHYHKYVVCRDPLASGNDNGIEIVTITDFLLRDEW